MDQTIPYQWISRVLIIPRFFTLSPKSFGVQSPRLEILRNKLLEYFRNIRKNAAPDETTRQEFPGSEGITALWKRSGIPGLRTGFPQQKIGKMWINLPEKMEFPAAIQGKRHWRRRENFNLLESTGARPWRTPSVGIFPGFI